MLTKKMTTVLIRVPNITTLTRARLFFNLVVRIGNLTGVLDC